MKIKIGTRGSRLALTQTHMVIDELKKQNQDREFEIVIIKTKGDKITQTSLDKIGDKGLFVKEIEEQLISGKIDIAIHSMKDMPSDIPEELMILPVLKREDPRDVLVTPHKISSIIDLPKSAKIATGSKRRSSQLKQLLPDVIILPIRGNVETRINKTIEQGIDGTILAMAGTNRLGIFSDDRITIIPFTHEQMIPAPAQGILALQIRDDRKDLLDMISSIVDEKTKLQSKAERLFLEEVNGGCHLPMGAYLEIRDERIYMYGLFGDEKCKKVMRKVEEGHLEDGLKLAKQIANELVNEVNR